MSGLLIGIIGGAIAGGATSIGAFLIFFQKNLHQFYKFKLDFCVGVLFILSALTTFSWEIIPAFLAGMLFIKASRLLIENVFMSWVSVTHIEYKAVTTILFIVFKNMAEGLAAGAALNFNHQGISQSLLSAIVLQNLLDGLMVAINLCILEVSLLTAFLGAAASGLLEFFSAIVGGYFSKEFSRFLPLVMSFSSGAMMFLVLEEMGKKAFIFSKNLLWNPKLVNGLVILFIVIIWRELL